MILATRHFTMADQVQFATLSGDINPIHIDPLAARKLIAGEVIVHGVHTLLWALDQLRALALPMLGLHQIDVRFPNALYLDKKASLILHKRTDALIELRVHCEDKTIASIRLTCADASAISADGDTFALVPGGVIRDVPLAQMAGQRGIVPYAAPASAFEECFPSAAALLGAVRLRALAACSRLVGMEYPGLRSIFSRLSVTCSSMSVPTPLCFEVSEADSRFNLVRVNVDGGGLLGKIEAFSPPLPPAQPDMRDIAARIPTGCFVGQTALIVGGSRGLGALTAKTIAAGGGHVIITYAVGKTEALQVVEEIRANGGQADALAYDVRQPAAEQLTQLTGAMPSHLYYFATSYIFKQKSAAFDRKMHEEFLTFYVYGFSDLLLTLLERAKGALCAFYPSSVAVENRPRDMTEYAMAKTAGELLCTDLVRHYPQLKIVVDRLPRLATEQTLSVQNQQITPAIDVLLPNLLKCADISATSSSH